MDQHGTIDRFATTYRFHVVDNGFSTIYTKGKHRIDVEWMNNGRMSVYRAEYSTSTHVNPIDTVTVDQPGKGHLVQQWMANAVREDTGTTDLTDARNIILQRRIHTMLGAHSARGYLRIGEIRDLLVDRPGESNIRAALEALHGNNYVLYTSNSTQFAGWKLNPEGPTDPIMASYDHLRTTASGNTQYDIITHAAKINLPDTTETIHNNLTDTYKFGTNTIRIRYSADGVSVKEAEWINDDKVEDALDYTDRDKAARIVEWFDKARAMHAEQLTHAARVAELEAADKQLTEARDNSEIITARSAFLAYRDLYDKLYATNESDPLANQVWDYLNAAANKEIAAEKAEIVAVIDEIHARIVDLEHLRGYADQLVNDIHTHENLDTAKAARDELYRRLNTVTGRKIIKT